MVLGVLASFVLVALSLAVRYAVSSGVVFWLVWRRFRPWAFARRIQAEEFRKSDLRREVRHSLVSSCVGGALMCVTYNPELRAHTKVYVGLQEHGYGWLMFSFIALLVIHDTTFYWSHRLLHRPWFFRRAHFVHHLSRNPSPFATFAFHPLEALIQFGWIVPLTFLMPLNIYLMNLFSVLSFAMNLIGHSGVEFYPTRWRENRLLKFLNTSTNHNRHHQWIHGNFGLYFTFWDRWMGTLYENRQVGPATRLPSVEIDDPRRPQAPPPRPPDARPAS